ncbi:MAG TPA: hypothetical protein VM680_00940 [Verrucomicrobiae bacterium]|nr:hypothetical protein [Verrucomicrobiae bacterium]
MTATNNTTDTSAANPITTIESLTREARRRGFNVHGGFQPPDLIPIVEAAIAQHNQRERGFTELSGDYIEWKQTMDNLQEFLAILKSLPAKLPYGDTALPTTNGQPAQSGQSDNPTPAQGTPPNGESSREKMNQLRKQIEQHIARLPLALQQQLKSVDHPSIQPSTPRRSPVPHPSNDASHASTDASVDASSAPPSDADSTDAKIDRERAAYLAQLLRESTPGKSPIDDLPPERQQALYQFLQELPATVVVKMIGAPGPLGWNLKTCDTSLRRFQNDSRKTRNSPNVPPPCTKPNPSSPRPAATNKPTPTPPVASSKSGCLKTPPTQKAPTNKSTCSSASSIASAAPTSPNAA